MNDYLIECESCSHDTRIVSTEDPHFCPMCGVEARSIVIEMDEDEEDDI